MCPQDRATSSFAHVGLRVLMLITTASQGTKYLRRHEQHVACNFQVKADILVVFLLFKLFQS